MDMPPFDCRCKECSSEQTKEAATASQSNATVVACASMAVSAGEPSGAGHATALQPQQSSQMQLRRRAIAKGRRRRGENLLPRLGLTLLMGAGLIMFASDSAPGAKSVGHREPTGSWDGLQASEDATGYGFGDLSGRHLAATLYPPTAPAPAPCPVEVGVGNSTYPSLGLEGASATVVQFVVLCFMFLGLAIVCDSFFEAALSRICEAMNLKDDVAGATWMAAGGSAPELATSVMGLFVSQSDIGFGTIVGSAVFNVLFVIACCAFVAPNLKLTWWPLARDCAYYCFSMSILVFVISDLKVEFYEAIILLMLYGVYVVIMYFNERLEAWVLTRVKASELATNALMKGLRDLFDNGVRAAQPDRRGGKGRVEWLWPTGLPPHKLPLPHAPSRDRERWPALPCARDRRRHHLAPC